MDRIRKRFVPGLMHSHDQLTSHVVIEIKHAAHDDRIKSLPKEEHCIRDLILLDPLNPSYSPPGRADR